MDTSHIQTSKLLRFEDAAAGHDGVLTDESGSIVVKPCTVAELAFYEETNARHPDFVPLIPTFMGTLQLGKSDQLQTAIDAAQSSTPMSAIVLPTDEVVTNTSNNSTPDAVPLRGKRIATDLAVVLENIAYGFVKPNILDVKLGARLWDDDAPDAKRQRLEKVARSTTSASLGFRIAGMKTFNGHSYKIFDKLYGRSLSQETVKQAFDELFDNASNDPDAASLSQVLPGAIEAVEDIEHTISHQESRMYSSSLLFVYEGDRNARKIALEALKQSQGVGDVDDFATDKAFAAQNTGQPIDIAKNDDDDEDMDEPELPKLFDVRVIDFAHATWTPGAGPDENMLHGIRSIIDIMKQMAS
ncbi:SAICAR synthase-like protein [Myriangium duriaei CBS 260.36]|uniref:Kinase n=1 Tax=Myriangium duriaei CBS 260.36 TaxID=1168546 RepID=A0A9P4ISM2_9PEZI|nr:SAICAR synthase-like protein [Myriangium duriaei CBS 260.36]